jgi:hypothetical protein
VTIERTPYTDEELEERLRVLAQKRERDEEDEREEG